MTELGEALYSLLSGLTLIGCWLWLYRNADQISWLKNLNRLRLENLVVIIVVGYWLFAPINFVLFRLTLPFREVINTSEDFANFLVGVALIACLGWLVLKVRQR